MTRAGDRGPIRSVSLREVCPIADQRAHLPDLAGADHLVRTGPIARPDLNHIPAVATELPGSVDRAVQTGGGANTMPVPVAIENIPARYCHLALPEPTRPKSLFPHIAAVIIRTARSRFR